VIQAERKIIHCDADCFFAAIEMRDDPSLAAYPVAVGGNPGKRGVISTCNYRAREFGVRSAMASGHALKLCPDLIIRPHRMAAYQEASQVMRDIFFDYTDRVEPLSMDEAFLDVTDSERCQGSATLMAQEIRERIEAALSITVSAGVAPNKFIAKVASDWDKPDGLTVIEPSSVAEFVRKLPVGNIWGVGRVTAEKMRRLGLDTCGHLQGLSLEALTQHFGSFGASLYYLCRGHDERAVKSTRRRKSLSIEHTYEQDLLNVSACVEQLPVLMEELQRRLERLDEGYQPLKAFVKVKFDDFSSTTLERAGSRPCQQDFRLLLEEAVARGARPVRLLGLGVRLVDLAAQDPAQQFELFQAQDTEEA